jgi:hypothetical protein
MDSPRSEATRRVGWSVTDLTKVPIELVAIQVALSLRHDQAGKTIVNPRNAGDVSEKKTAEIRNPAFHGLGFAPNGKVNYRRSCNGSLYHMDTLSTSVSPYGGLKPLAPQKYLRNPPKKKKLVRNESLYVQKWGFP